MEESALLDVLLKNYPSNQSACLRGISLVCPSRQLMKASQMADTCKILCITINAALCVYVVPSEKKSSDYIVIPGKFCSCMYFFENVIKGKTNWTCKHDLAVRLKLGLCDAPMEQASSDRLLAELRKQHPPFCPLTTIQHYLQHG